MTFNDLQVQQTPAVLVPRGDFPQNHRRSYNLWPRPCAESTAVHQCSGKSSFFPSPTSTGDCVLCQQSGQQSGLSLATGFPFLALGAPARPDPDLTRSCGLKLNTARPAGRDQRSLPQSTSSKRLGPDPGRRLGAELASDPLPLAQSFSNLSVHHLNGLLKQIAELHPRSSCLSKFSVGPENLPF